MAFPPSDGVLSGLPVDWLPYVLILHTLFASGAATTTTLGPYTEQQCHQAAENYEAAVRITGHYAIEGEANDPDMVLKAIAICLPAPGAPPRRP